jgi:signal transduction histidine kinase
MDSLEEFRDWLDEFTQLAELPSHDWLAERAARALAAGRGKAKFVVTGPLVMRVLRKHAQGQDVGPALEEGVRIIVREVETLRAMVDEFSRYARMPRPQPVDVDLEPIVLETVKLYRGLKPGVEVEGAVAPDAAHAWADPEQLRGALINLLDNAVEATEAPGRVEVRTTRYDGRVHLQVADSGRGIPAEAKEKLFLPHFSTKGRGTGLGLAIVHRIVSDHHGTIRVEDNSPRGTVFTIELPAR